MEFKRKSVNALGRNRYGEYMGYRKPKISTCENGTWVLRSISITYSSGSYLLPDRSNYATIRGLFDYIVDEDYTADTRYFAMTPKSPDNPHSVAYSVVGDKLVWNVEDFGTTTKTSAIYNNVYGAFNGVDYTGSTVMVITGANVPTSTESVINFFRTSGGSSGPVEIGSGETSLFFVAQATRTITYTSLKTGTTVVTDILNEGDGKLFLETNLGSAVENSVDIPANYGASAITGYVRVVDDADNSATAEITVIQQGQ